MTEKPGQPKRVTIKTVAEDAGVSVAAVSKVLREAYGVSDALRAKVRASMEKLDYRPHAAARGMRGRTYTLGVVFPDIQNPFFSDVMTGISQALERSQYQALLGISQSSVAMQRSLVDAMIDRQMDGLILVGSAETPEELNRISREKPVVMVGHHSPVHVAYDTVNNNDQLGGALVVRHLVQAGYKRIAMLNLPNQPEYSVLAERETGYRRAMIEADLGKKIEMIYARQTVRDTQNAARNALLRPDRPDAIFCWTDFIALEVISVARELGLTVGDDIAVVGYDNTVYCDFAQNSLTSVDQSGEQLGLQATRLLIERIKGRPEPERMVVQPRLVARRSSARSG
jgi:DNA-binding LacI/PurR family transcriptional regulator